MRKKIGECLIQAGLITEEDLQIALAEHRRTGDRIGAVLVRLNFATEKQITKALAYQLGFQYASLADDPPEASAIVLIPKEVALKRACVAVRLEKNLLTVAMSDPLLFSLVQDLEFQTGYRIRQVVATRADILDAIQTGYADEALARMQPEDGIASRRREDDMFQQPSASGSGRRETDGAAQIVDLVDLVVNSAITSRASDIHIEPMEKGVLVRHRLDGLLKEVMDLPKWVHEGLVARLKIMAEMDVAEQRLPQDGRLRVKTEDGKDVDFRVSTLRTLYGEKIVLRVLDHRKGAPPLEELGLSSAAIEEMRHSLRHQHGMLLVVGPTGSGKTTTLSSALTSIRSGKTNILTIEDPIEYQIPGVNQTQVNEKAKLTFAGALRAILRQDPDVVLVGEIRDQETAKIAMQAAQTGHLVLSTLHTVDASESINRIIDFFPPHQQSQARAMIAGTLKGIVSQRLVRTADGNGRVATAEILVMTGRVHDMILDPKLTGQLPEVIAEGSYYGMQTFDQHLLQHLEAGRITMEEAVHVATSPHDFKLMVAAAGKPKGEGQAQGPGYKPPREDEERATEETPGVATVAPPPSAPAPPVSAPAQSAPPPASAPPPGF